MSGIVKSVQKTFKKVISSTPFKIAAVALGIGAAVFTGGAALGILPAWGSVAGGLTTALGLGGDSVLGSMLTGAITQAGFGSGIGSVLNLATGKDPLKGAATGALIGAGTGAATGAFTNTMGFSGGGNGLLKSNAADVLSGGSDGSMLYGQSGNESGVSNLYASAPTPSSSGGLLDKGGWLERNGTLVGGLAAGVGKGILDYASAEAAGERQEDQNKFTLQRDQTQRDAVSGNYRTGTGGLLVPPVSPTQYLTPTQKWGRYRFDPQTNRIVFEQGA